MPIFAWPTALWFLAATALGFLPQLWSWMSGRGREKKAWERLQMAMYGAQGARQKAEQTLHSFYHGPQIPMYPAPPPMSVDELAPSLADPRFRAILQPGGGSYDVSAPVPPLSPAPSMMPAPFRGRPARRYRTVVPTRPSDQVRFLPRTVEPTEQGEVPDWEKRLRAIYDERRRMPGGGARSIY